ncbi:WW domain binding protein VOPP1 isoform X3 [Paramisgurnus dabryanus]|uniref:WW domain binding protein VOPP1 isoform X3 n=1 Tax=Paramisgurnus dabryanus TaxID=90735 RepID=UPI0031F425CF
MLQLCCLLISMCLIAETVAEKKYCWYFEEGYPVYFVLLLVIAIAICCGAGYFLRRRVHTISDRPDFNVTFTRHPIISPGLGQSGFYGESETAVISTAYPVRTHPGHMTAVYSALPPYYCQPPPSYDQAIRDSQKK